MQQIIKKVPSVLIKLPARHKGVRNCKDFVQIETRILEKT